MEIRGHHLLCLYGFNGLGYNKRFIDNLQQILDLLRRDYGQKIKLIDGVDDICRYCPHCRNNQCSNNQIDPQDLDRKVLSKIDLRKGSYYRAVRVFTLIKENIKLSDLERWCRECPWYGFGYCLSGFKNKNLP